MKKIILSQYLRICAYSLSLFLILITALLSLDIFSKTKDLINQVAIFILNLIPTMILIIATLLGWKKKKEKIAGLIFLILAIVYFTLSNNPAKNSINFLIIEIPLIIISFSYLLSSHYEKKINMD